jgi:Arc/MetJ-type ribon-helix-helix transcriptional regulator
MPKSKIAITVDSTVLAGLDALVRAGHYANRSRAVEAAVEAAVDRAHGTRLARACSELDHAEERAMAEEGLSDDVVNWPGY